MRPWWWAPLASVLLLATIVAAGVMWVRGDGGASGPRAHGPAAASETAEQRLRGITSWVYQLQGYDHGRLDALAKAPQQLAVIDLARDADRDYFTANEVGALRRSGKVVLAYFEIGSIEDFRPEYPELRARADDLILNRWSEWPNEFFVRYWDERWWDDVIRPRLDQARRAGFDGVYLDTPLAYEQVDLGMAGKTREWLARAMVNLIMRISDYLKSRQPDTIVVAQNSPELRHLSGYLQAIDGLGMEELFFQATDKPCVESWCAENLADARAVRAAGKLVLAVDYATDAEHVRIACDRYRQDGFAGYVTTRDLDRISLPCQPLATSSAAHP